jgi:acetyltransferase
VNPSRTEIWGTPCFASVAGLPEPPDHLAIYTPADTTLRILRDGAAAGARSATVYAAGFGEGGDVAGTERAGELRKVLDETGLAAVGPNCMGVACGRSKFATIPDESLQALAPGPVAVISQSGALCASINRAANDLDLKVGYLVSCGNQIGRPASAFIDYFADQQELRVILCYIEAVPDAAGFFDAARRARMNGKTVVVVKIGGSDAGRASALAHTGSLAGRSEVFDAYAAMAGIVRLNTLEDAIEALEYLSRAPLPGGSRTAVMTNSGALRCLITEAADRIGTKLATLAEPTRVRLRQVLDQPDVDNPLDTKRTIPTEQYAACLEALIEAPEVDVLLVAEELPGEDGIARRVANLHALAIAADGAPRHSTSVVMIMPMPVAPSAHARKVRAAMPQLPMLRETEKALRVVHALAAAGMRPMRATALFGPPSDTAAAASVRSRAAGLDRPMALNEVESKALLQSYGIAVSPQLFIRSAADVVAAAAKIGFPVVLKAVSADIAHKTEAGLVILGVQDADGASSAASVLLERCRACNVEPDGILVARHMAAGIETVIGVTSDVEMGSAVMFGTGGIWVELVKDVAFAPACLDRTEALAMMRTTRAGRLLDGYRGKPGDHNAVADALVNLGRLARDLGDVLAAVDINPFVVYEQGAFALDALVVLQPPHHRGGQ